MRLLGSIAIAATYLASSVQALTDANSMSFKGISLIDEGT